MAGCKLKRALCSGEDGRQHIKWSFRGLPGARFSCCMDDKRKEAVGKRKVANIPLEHHHTRVRYQMWSFGCKGLWRAREYRNAGAQGET